jgi:hypothetical protein
MKLTEVLEHADGQVLTLRTRAGKIARVDDSESLRRKQIGVLVTGYAYIQGTYDSAGVLHAQSVARAMDSAAGSLTIVPHAAHSPSGLFPGRMRPPARNRASLVIGAKQFKKSDR